MINFEVLPYGDYRDRTIENIKQSDITVAFALDFETHGERLTRTETIKQGKLYFPVFINDIDDNGSNSKFSNIQNIRNTIERSRLFVPNPLIINIAGNGIYTLNISQWLVDKMIFEFMKDLLYIFPGYKVRCGGQTGIDEAGAKAGDKLNLDTTVLAPFGWKFRDITGKDICNEVLFKKRFL